MKAGIRKWLAANALGLVLLLGGGISLTVTVVSRASGLDTQVVDHEARLDSLEPTVRRIEIDQREHVTKLQRAIEDLKDVTETLRPRRPPWQ